MISDEEKRRLFDLLEEIQSELHEVKDENIPKIQREQEAQNEGIEKLSRAMFDNEDNEQTGGGVRTKTNFVYNTVQNWQQQVKGGRIIVAGVVFLIASGAITYVVNLVTGGGP